ncbi:hypothetical protein Efla_000654 [Eimeria flavescens]
MKTGGGDACLFVVLHSGRPNRIPCAFLSVLQKQPESSGGGAAPPAPRLAVDRQVRSEYSAMLEVYVQLVFLCLSSSACLFFFPFSFLFCVRPFKQKDVLLPADWDKSGRSLRIGIGGYFYDKPTYQRPVEEITAALDSFKTISASVKPQLDLIKNANVAAAKSIVRVEKANKRKRGCEKHLWRKEAALRKLQQKAQSGKDPNAHQKVKALEDDVQLARNNLQIAEAELAREMQHTMNGSAPEAAMQVARAVEAMILFLVGSGVDVSAVRASIRALEEAHYISPLTAAGNQQQLLLQSLSTKKEHSISHYGGADLARGSSQTSRPPSATDPGSQQATPGPPGSAAASQDGGRPSASPTNPFTSE